MNTSGINTTNVKLDSNSHLGADEPQVEPSAKLPLPPKPSYGGIQTRAIFTEAAAKIAETRALELAGELTKGGSETVTCSSIMSGTSEKVEISLTAVRDGNAWKAHVLSRENGQGCHGLVALRNDQNGNWYLMVDKMEAAADRNERNRGHLRRGRPNDVPHHPHRRRGSFAKKVAILGGLGAASFAAHRSLGGPRDTNNLPLCTPSHLRRLNEQGKSEPGSAFLTNTGGHTTVEARLPNGRRMYDNIGVGNYLRAENFNQPETRPHQSIKIPGSAKSVANSIAKEQAENKYWWFGNTCSDRSARIIERHFKCRLSSKISTYGDLVFGVGYLMPGKSPNKVAKIVKEVLENAGIPVEGRNARRTFRTSDGQRTRLGAIGSGSGLASGDKKSFTTGVALD